MPAPLRRSAPAAALLAAAALAACSGGGDRPAADAALDRDLTLAAGAAARPALGDSLAMGDTAVALAPAIEPEPAPAPAPTPRVAPVRAPTRVAERPAAPRATAPAAAPAPAPAPEAAVPVANAGRTLAGGTQFAASLNGKVCSESNRPGDKLVATLASDVTGSGGATVLRAGTPVVLEVARVDAQSGTAEFLVRGVSADGGFVPLAAEVSPVSGQLVQQELPKAAGEDRGKLAKGAIIGAIAGQVLGRNTKSTIIGGAVGAAAGAVAAKASTKHEACLPAGVAVRIRLTEAAVVPAAQ